MSLFVDDDRGEPTKSSPLAKNACAKPSTRFFKWRSSTRFALPSWRRSTTCRRASMWSAASARGDASARARGDTRGGFERASSSTRRPRPVAARARRVRGVLRERPRAFVGRARRAPRRRRRRFDPSQRGVRLRGVLGVYSRAGRARRARPVIRRGGVRRELRGRGFPPRLCPRGRAVRAVATTKGRAQGGSRAGRPSAAGRVQRELPGSVRGGVRERQGRAHRRRGRPVEARVQERGRRHRPPAVVHGRRVDRRVARPVARRGRAGRAARASKSRADHL